jgi:hypothetical protein
MTTSQNFPQLPTFDDAIPAQPAAPAPLSPAPSLAGEDPENSSSLSPQSSLTPAQASAALSTDPPLLPDLPQRQQLALDLLLTGATDTSIAAAVGVTRRTVYTWRTADHLFSAHLQRRRQDLFDQNADRLRCMLSAALDTLDRQVKDPYNPTSHRAARTLLLLSRLGNHLIAIPRPTASNSIPPSPILEPPARMDTD